MIFGSIFNFKLKLARATLHLIDDQTFVLLTRVINGYYLNLNWCELLAILYINNIQIQEEGEDREENISREKENKVLWKIKLE